MAFFDDESEAYACEKELIASLGRENLTNIKSGGGALSTLTSYQIKQRDKLRKGQVEYVGLVQYQFIWCTEIRQKFLTGDVATFVESEIRRLCEANGWPIGALNIQEDHVHLFLSALPSVAPSLIANTLKGITARQVFKHYPEVKKQLWGGSFWARSYYVGTVGDMTEDTVKKYIEEGQD